jgi:hypothetical protein
LKYGTVCAPIPSSNMATGDMKLYAGLEVSLETTSVCMVDEDGRMRLEAQCLSEPAVLIAMLQKAGDCPGRPRGQTAVAVALLRSG